MVKPFNSDTVSIVANFARLPRGEQNLLLGKTKEDTKDDVDPSGPPMAGADRYHAALEHLYQLIQDEKPSFAERIDPRDFLRVVVVEPQRSFERLRAQSGAFLLSALHDRYEEESIRKWNSHIPMYHPYVPSLCTITMYFPFLLGRRKEYETNCRWLTSPVRISFPA